MENNKLFRLLKALPEEELKEFKKFVASPFFSKGRDLTKYFSVVVKHYPEFKVTMDKIRNSYFKSSKDIDKQMRIIRTLNSELIRMCEDYFVILSVFKSKFTYHNYLVKTYVIKKLFSFAEKEYANIIENKDWFSGGFFKYSELYTINTHMENAKFNSNKEREVWNFTKTQTNVLLSFLLGSASYLLNNLNTYSLHYNFKDKNNNLTALFKNLDVEKFIEEVSDEGEHTEQIKLTLYMIMIIIDVKNYDKYIIPLVNEYKKMFDDFGDADQINYFVHIVNIYTAKGTREAQRLKFEIIRFFMDKNIYPGKNFPRMNMHYYSVFFMQGLIAKEIKWSEDFYKKYIEKVEPDIKDNLTEYSLAFLNHYKGNYVESLAHIGNFKFTEEALTFEIKLLQLQNYYKLMKTSGGYYDTFNYALDALAHFFDLNKKMSENYKKLGKEFVKGMRLLRSYFKGDKKTQQDLKFELENYRSDTKNFWLQDIIDEILNEGN